MYNLCLTFLDTGENPDLFPLVQILLQDDIAEELPFQVGEATQEPRLVLGLKPVGQLLDLGHVHVAPFGVAWIRRRLKKQIKFKMWRN